MPVSRRQLVAGFAAGTAAVATGLARPAIASSEPIKVGFLPALTGPSSSTGIAINRGTLLAIEEINAAGGVNGRKMELISRDTQSDPTKAVNGATELTRREKVQVVWGPLNSGEALAATPLIARDGVPQLDFVLGRFADRREEVAVGLSQCANQPAGRRRGHALCHGRVEAQEDCHHR